MVSRTPPLTSARAEPSASELRVEQLYAEHQAFVWRNARRLGCADDWVDDAVQEVFLVAARRLAELQADSNVRGWLFAITYRIVSRLQRGRARYRAQVQRFAEQAEARVPSPEAGSEAARHLRRLLAQLDDAKRVVVILVELEGMTLAETAAVMSVPAGTVATRLRAARLELKQLLERERRTSEEP